MMNKFCNYAATAVMGVVDSVGNEYIVNKWYLLPIPDGITPNYFTDGRDASRHMGISSTHWLVEAPHPPLPAPVKTQAEKDAEALFEFINANYDEAGNIMTKHGERFWKAALEYVREEKK